MLKHVVSSFLDHSWRLDFVDKNREHMAASVQLEPHY
jgi:hypothetical protein